MQLNLAVPTRALAIAAHPDDVEFGCGATLAKWADAGCVINHLICTDGSKGSWDPNTDRDALVAVRQLEQRAAAKALGSTGEVVFLTHVDGELSSGLAERAEIAYWIRVLRPDIVLGHDPWKQYRLHPDHRHAGRLAVEGIVAARDPHFFPEQDVPHHRPSALLLFEAEVIDHVEDVAGFADAKIAALESHESQLRSTMGVEVGSAAEAAQRAAFRASVRERLTEHGAHAGVAEGEAFKAITEL